MTCLRPCMAAYERDDSQKLSDHVAKQPAAPTKRTLEGSRGSYPPPWSPCSVPRSRSVRRGLLCGRSCPEAPPLRQTRLSPSPPSARDPLSLRRLGDPSRRAPLEALCHCSASTLLQLLQRFLRRLMRNCEEPRRSQDRMLMHQTLSKGWCHARSRLLLGLIVRVGGRLVEAQA